MLKQLFLQLFIKACLSSQYTPHQEPTTEQADRENLPPGPLKVAPHGAVHFPGPVTAFADGELNGLVVHLILRAFGRGLPLGAQGEGPHIESADEREMS